MKIKEILEARYAGDINKISVHQVFQLYKEHNTEMGIGADPLIHAKQTYGSGTPEETNIVSILTFRSSQQSQTDLMRWVREYTKINRLPYTGIANRGTQAIQIRYSIPPSKRGLHEARYAGEHPIVTGIKSALAREADFYINIKDKKRADAAERGIIAAFGQPDEQGPATEDEYRNMLWYLPDEIMQLQIIDGLSVHKKKIVRGQPVVTARAMMNISLL